MARIPRLRSRGRIFLSYSSVQRDIARKTAIALRNADYEVFFDEGSLPAGGDYNQRIANAITRADAMICLVSPEYFRDGSYARFELAEAEKKWPSPVGRILPVVISPTELSAVPEYLSSITLLEPTGYIPAEVVSSVGRLRKWVDSNKLVYLAAIVIAAAASVFSWLAFDVFDNGRHKAALNEVLAEIETNARVVENLRKNAVSLSEAVKTVAGAVRTPGIEILAGLFPHANIDPEVDASSLTNLYNERMEWLAQSGLLNDEIQRGRASAACAAIVRTIDRTATVVASLTDVENERFHIADDNWKLNARTIMRNESNKGAEINQLYSEMIEARRSYDRVSASVAQYLSTMHDFCSAGTIDQTSLSGALASERLAVRMLHAQLEDTLAANEKIAPLLISVRERVE